MRTVHKYYCAALKPGLKANLVWRKIRFLTLQAQFKVHISIYICKLRCSLLIYLLRIVGFKSKTR